MWEMVKQREMLGVWLLAREHGCGFRLFGAGSAGIRSDGPYSHRAGVAGGAL